tara:strand:- start:293 stop:739 length:447 start_codon:yes stop_codon:yes gene_type:complete
MLSLKSIRSIKVQNLPKILLALLTLFLMVSGVASAEVHPCENAGIQLRGDLDVVMNRGGLWALMEQTEGLQDTSVIGMQADGKLARVVGNFETMCEEGEKPTKQLFVGINNLLGNARVIWNPRSSGEAIVKLITDLNKKLDSLLLKMK